MALDLKKKSLIGGFKVPFYLGGTQYILAPAYAAPRSMINDQNITEQPESKCDSSSIIRKRAKLPPVCRNVAENPDACGIYFLHAKDLSKKHC